MMRKLILLGGFALLLCSGLVACSEGEKYAKTYYVALDGNDASRGTKSDPFATLEKARDEIRALKAGKGLPDGGIQVLLMAGDYTRSGSFVLTAEDSGTEKCPIVYGGASKERVRFLGGRELTQWKPISSSEKAARLDPSVRNQIVEVNLKEAGVVDYGSVAAKQSETSRADLFCNGAYMPLARWPNAPEWVLIEDVPMSGPNRYYYDNITHYGRFAYKEDRPSRWKDQSDLWMQGYWVHDWRDEIHRIERIDTLKKEIYPMPPYHGYGYRTGQRFFYLNVFEELDQPGEWFLERTTDMLYFYPPTEIASAEVIFPELQEPMIVMDSTLHITIEGITFEASRSGGIVLSGGSYNQIRGCDFLNLGHLAVSALGGSENRIQSCDFYHLAQGAIELEGGDRLTLTPSGHVIENCEVHHNARIFKTNTPAILLKGVGIRLAHCFLHDTPHTAIFHYGNDHIFEYNEFTRIANETGDVGCLYSMADWTYMGNVVRYNYFHDIHSSGHLGCFTIYPDLPNGGIHLHGNIFNNTDWVFHTNSGRGMLIENNLMLETHGVSYKIWPFKEFFYPGGQWEMVEHLEEVKYDQPPYVTRYPVLGQLAEDFKQTDSTVEVMDRQLCKGNIIRNNIATGPVFLRFIGEVDLEQIQVENNLIATEVAYSHSPITTYDDFDSYTDDDPKIIEQLKASGNLLMMKQNPGIKNPGEGDFSFIPDSPAAKMQFEPIPFEKMGLQNDRYRKVSR